MGSLRVQTRFEVEPLHEPGPDVGHVATSREGVDHHVAHHEGVHRLTAVATWMRVQSRLKVGVLPMNLKASRGGAEIAESEREGSGIKVPSAFTLPPSTFPEVATLTEILITQRKDAKTARQWLLLPGRSPVEILTTAHEARHKLPMKPMVPLAFLALLGEVMIPTTTGGAEPASSPGQSPTRSGPVELRDHGLVDAQGPFLGLGVSYFTALWRFHHDRPRLDSDLQFLSAQGFRYYRMLSMVGWYAGWDGLEIAPIGFTSRAGKRVAPWPDYWKELGALVDLAYDRFGLRTQITIFADAQLMPDKRDRIEHMRRLLAEVVPGREQKIILLEVANEAWQNGFPGEAGVADLREFTRHLADRTTIPIATTSNHEDDFDRIYADSAADIATWHFSRDRRSDDGWKPVHDCWDAGERRGFPPVSSNEPIGPGASVATENSPVRLVMAAAFAYTAKLPMYVFHSEAGVFGKSRFEETPGIGDYRHLMDILPSDLPNWKRHDGREKESPFTVFADGNANRFWPEVPDSRDGCVRMIGSRAGDRFVCVPIGIRENGLQVQAREPVRFKVFDPLTGKVIMTTELTAGGQRRLPQGPGGLIILGQTLRQASCGP